MSKTFVVGDIHGAYRALIQCLEKASFDYSNDHLICLGDVCDGWPETKQCIDELLKMKHVTYVLGNHDTWFLNWMKTGEVEPVWFKQGGQATIESYGGDNIPLTHIAFLETAFDYFLLDNKLFVHAGINPDVSLAEQRRETFFWDRSFYHLVSSSFKPNEKFTIYEEVFIGHTPVNAPAPVQCGEVWLMDTGAGWSGVLSLMDVNEKKVFVSDNVPSLYPGTAGRSRKIN